MSKLVKLLLGLATIWPFAYIILFFFFVFSTVIFPPTDAPGPPPLIALILPLHLLTMLLVVGLMIFYVVNVFRSERVDKDKKVLWLLLLLLGGGVAMPVYWYLHIWKDTPITPAPPSQLRSSESSTLNVDMRAPREAEYVPPREPPDWRQFSLYNTQPWVDQTTKCPTCFSLSRRCQDTHLNRNPMSDMLQLVVEMPMSDMLQLVVEMPMSDMLQLVVEMPNTQAERNLKRQAFSLS